MSDEGMHQELGLLVSEGCATWETPKNHEKTIKTSKLRNLETYVQISRNLPLEIVMETRKLRNSTETLQKLVKPKNYNKKVAKWRYVPVSKSIIVTILLTIMPMSSLLVTSYISFYVIVNISEAIFTVPCKFPGFQVLGFRKPENQWKQAETSGNME